MALTSKYNKLTGKSILIIGGSSGIGTAVALASLVTGANVIISSSSRAKLDNTVAALAPDFPKQTIDSFACNLGDPVTVEADLDRLFAATKDRLQTVDHVVYTAADRLNLGGLQTVTPELIARASHMHFVVPLMLGKVAARWLPKSRAASLPYTGGTVSEKPGKGWAMTAYFGGGLQSLARALAVDMAPVRVNIVRPGLVDAGLWSGMAEEARAAMFKSVGERVLTGCVGRVEDVAEAFLWLMKDGNASGAVAGSDGGALLV